MEADAKIIEFVNRRRSPTKRRVSRDGQKVYCKFGCGKKCTKNGIHSHELHHCPRNPQRKPREFGREACPICGKMLDKHYLRQHLYTQHTAAAVKIYNNSLHSGAAVATARPRAPLPSPPKYNTTSTKAAPSKEHLREPKATNTRVIAIPSSMASKNTSPATKRKNIWDATRNAGLDRR